jgi:flagellar M-ring protein FliF
MAGVAELKEKAAALAAGYSRGQKVAAAGAVVVVVLGVLVVTRLAGSTDWAPLYTEVSAEDGGKITSELTSKGVPYQLADGGTTIMVPADQVYDTRLAMASTELPSTSKVGYGVLDSQGLTTSEFGQRVGYQRAMEGELATTIEAIDTVKSAKVHLALPEKKVFATDTQKATASVLVTTRSGTTLSEDQVTAITNLVASGIEGMKPEDVTVADASGNVLAAPGQSTAARGSGTARQRQTDAFDQQLSTSIESLLASTVGTDGVRVRVAADLDFDERATTRESFEQPQSTPAGTPTPLNATTKKETYTGSGAPPGGVLGADTPATAATGTGGTTDYSLDDSDVRYAMNRVVEQTNAAPGAIQRLSVAVALDEQAIPAAVMPQVTQLVNAAAGIDASRGDVVAVTRVPFDTSAAAASASEERHARALAQAADRRHVLQTAALGVFLLAVLLTAFLLHRRASRRRRMATQLLAELQREPQSLTPGPGPAVAAALEVVDESDHVTDEDPTVLTPVLVSGPPGAAELAAVATPEDTARASRQAAVTELIDSQPEEVAQLMRNWLGDRRTARR